MPDPLRARIFNGIKNQLLAKRVKYFFKKKYLYKRDLKDLKYVFFPLHTEPEVSLLVYARPFLNQIEVIRSLAISLPIDTVLVIKEHPWMIGKRSINAYKKILNIPRVYFADPKIKARDLIVNSNLVSVITGSIALEAAILEKPVITFGDIPYNLLPNKMVQRCQDLRHLNILIKNMIDDYHIDEVALKKYIAAVFETTISLNLYSVLLKKENVFAERNVDYENEINALADEIIKKSQHKNADLIEGSALW